jgi:2-octaprenyl-6-methoxyphenol hydroxylase
VVKNKVTILGGGISGMITALALATKNIKTIIIEKGDLSSTELTKDLRTTALSKASQSILQCFSIWEELTDYTTPILDIYVIDSHKSKSVLHFPSSLVKEDAMGYMIKNADLRSALYKLVSHNPLIEIIKQTEYESIEVHDSYNIIHLLNKQPLKTELVIVCDGKFSRAKEQLFDSKIDKDYKQKAIIFNITHEKNHCNFAIEHFLPTGPFAILPLKGGYESSIVWSQENEIADMLLKLSMNEFKMQLQSILRNSLGDFKISSPINSYPLSATLVNKYYTNNVVILADAAHTIHPLAGQGLNLGIRDIASLIPILEQCNNTGLPFLNLYFKPYNKTRQIGNLEMFFITDFLNFIFSNNSKILGSFRHAGLSIIDSNNFLKSLLIKYAMGTLKAK